MQSQDIPCTHSLSRDIELHIHWIASMDTWQQQSSNTFRLPMPTSTSAFSNMHTALAIQ